VTVPEPSPTRIIGIGASAGGIDALLRLLAVVPAEYPHAICVVQHVAPTGNSVLASILDRRCALAVETAAHGERIVPGHVYVAPPDRHLTVRHGTLDLARGPLVNHVRPAADPLLSSLAEDCGHAAVAVVLSGALGDGALGARAVAEAGGRVLVQDPAEALVPSMPERAIAESGAAAEVLTAAAIGEQLARLGPAPRVAIRSAAKARS
jgi:two-component system, chemotaxis family, protein-glutamate methylesterase/glutaminase